MENAVITHFEDYNQRRYSRPWVAIVDPQGKPDFEHQVGAYTGNHNNGEDGDLYVFEPAEKQIYMYGQKDYRGNNTVKKYVQYINGEFVPVKKLLEALALRDGR